MDTPAPKFIFLFLLSILIVCGSTGVKDIEQKFPSSHRELPITNTLQHDSLVNFPTLTNPGGQVTNPVPVTPTPSIITVPSATPPPATVSPATPTTTIPPANPVTTPAVVARPAASGQSWCVAKSGAPANSVQAALDYACGIGGADCSAIQQGASCYNPITLQNHASYAFNSYYQKHPGPTSCDFGGTAVLTNVNPSSGSCVFPTSSSTSTTPPTPTSSTSTAPPTPSSSSSITPTTPSSSTSTPPITPSPITPTPTIPSPITPTPTTPSPITPTPTTTSPVTPTPTTSSSSGATTPTGSWGGGPLPNILNASNPAFGGTTTSFGDSPPITNTSSISMSTSLHHPFIGCIIIAASIITGAIV